METMRNKILIFVLCLAYIALRFWHLTDSCLWFDEIFSVHAAEHAWGDLLSFVALDLIHPPLFYVLLKLWIGVGGESLLWLRSLPVIFAVVSLFPFIAFLLELKRTTSTIAISLFFLIVNGSLLKYSQEVRMYSLLQCLSLVSMWLFARYLIKGKSFVPLVIVNIILVYTHYFGWFVVAGEVAAILIFQRIKWRRIALMVAITLAAFVPWMIAVISAAKKSDGLGQNIGWMSRPGIMAILQFKLALIEPFYYAAASIDPASIYRITVPLLLIITAAFVIFLLNWKQNNADDKLAIYLLFIFIILPSLTAFAASWLLPYSIWGTRHLIVVFAPVSILLAIALAKVSSLSVKTAAITLIFLFSGYAFVLQAGREKPDHIWCDWKIAASSFALGREPGENIYAFEDLAAYHLWFSLKDSDARVILVNGTGLSEDKAYFLPRGFDGVKTITEDQIAGEWVSVVFRAENMEITKSPIANLIARGYAVHSYGLYSAGAEKVYLVRLRKME